MCRFLSGVVLPSGDVITSPVDDSHENIIEANDIRESIAGKINIVRVEYTSETLADLDTYKLNIDQDDVPDWFDEPMRERVADTMRGMVSRMILKESKTVLLGGKWIIPKGVTVKHVVSCTPIILNAGTVETNYGTVETNYGTVETNYGTVETNYGTVETNFGTVKDNFGTVETNSGTGRIITDRTKC